MLKLSKQKFTCILKAKLLIYFFSKKRRSEAKVLIIYSFLYIIKLSKFQTLIYTKNIFYLFFSSLKLQKNPFSLYWSLKHNNLHFSFYMSYLSRKKKLSYFPMCKVVQRYFLQYTEYLCVLLNVNLAT